MKQFNVDGINKHGHKGWTMMSSQFSSRVKRCRIVTSALAALTCWCCTANAQTSEVQVQQTAALDTPKADMPKSESEKQPQKRTPFEGKVDHDESMPPLGDEFAVGKKFKPDLLTAQTPDNVWIPVPDWYAGTFHGDSQNVKLMYFYKTGNTLPEHVIKEAGDVITAQQRSKDGQYWQYVKIPRTQIEEILVGKAYNRAVREDLISVSDSKLILKFNYFEILVDPKGTIRSTRQIQSINTYTPLDDGLVMLRTSMKSFDGNGQPDILQHGEKILKQIAPYHEIDEKDGDNLKQLFVEYLKKTGREEQIPTG
jgi:hypothetical protein